MTDKKAFVLPVSIVSPTDVARLVREVESIDSFFRQAEIRQNGTQTAMPRMSKLMDQLVAENQLNLLQEDHRQYISKSLEVLHTTAPVIHMSFSVDPPGSYVQKIVDYMRKNIHGQVLVTIGLQPNIGAGCVIRTTNKIFDFSLREFFKEKRGFFIDKMHEAISDEPGVVVENQSEVPERVAAGSTEAPTPQAVAEVEQSAQPAAAPAVEAGQASAPTPQPISEPAAQEQAQPTPVPLQEAQPAAEESKA